ncbi:putative 50S ribosomal protein mrp49 protein [Rosellinia necatrix]|uniref:Putative 50S ribosomal protein mrp49 protein n=1 Tax=Rosellinia necatrix TaxID=77044 RepID=A0A1W2TUU2_ROSNE|nr:putative 50S ribosomal protein mrp49 protein [Rosellinia necatrix]
MRIGPGAAVLPPEVTRIHMNFALKWQQGHFGPRKFWKQCLGRLKYWNPEIPMIVNRSSNNAGPATMSIYFRQPSSSEAPSITEIVRNMLPLAQQPRSSTTDEHPAPPPEEGEKVVTIDMKNIHSDAILAEFLTKTGATLIHPTPEEVNLQRQIDDMEERAAVDRSIVKKFIEDKRHEERMLALAKQEAEAIKAANQ